MPYESHEAAAIFPMMAKPEIEELSKDIRANGLLCPIVIFEGKILDGRNREEACQLAGVAPRYVDYKLDLSPVVWVLSMNSKRRHMTTGQKVAAAVASLPLLEAEAKARQARKSVKEIIPEQNKGQARDKAAAAAGVNARYVSDAKKIKETHPEKFEEIASGKKTVPAARAEIEKEMKMAASAAMGIPIATDDPIFIEDLESILRPLAVMIEESENDEGKRESIRSRLKPLMKMLN